MAYTKIHTIKATVDKAIEYICNPDKTDEQIYVSSYACAPETAAIGVQLSLNGIFLYAVSNCPIPDWTIPKACSNCLIPDWIISSSLAL